jgi:hypothetical protein
LEECGKDHGRSGRFSGQGKENVDTVPRVLFRLRHVHELSDEAENRSEAGEVRSGRQPRYEFPREGPNRALAGQGDREVVVGFKGALEGDTPSLGPRTTS